MLRPLNVKPLLILACITFPVLADARPDLSNPEIWQEKKTTDRENPDPCEVLQPSACPGYDDKKTDLQKEQERREKNRWYKRVETGKWRE
ncbi:hypothetical protein SAMN05216563_104248 [Phytobacter palmae]|uniref:Uncharacterized protein n=1 Tax=Phytobacter palmae TaxID=1855371 RepID=A0ABU9V057_9ENTR|nr:hypothetical protein [Escherichia coli]SFE29446.1 hypothetical protein SAMN05216563_104248 [Phytobacter palmae]